MRPLRVVVVGAGIGGLAAALLLSARGAQVTVVEKADEVGGKARRVRAGLREVDAGPTVFTLRWVFDELFEAAGFDASRELALTELKVLARHAWEQGGVLDLFTDTQRSADAVSQFSGPAEADRFRAFCERAQRVYRCLERSFMASPRPSLPGLIRRAGLAGLPGLLATSPFVSMWQALGAHFQDPRLRQLFGRYATYCGSSPWLAPSTLMLVAHAEKMGVWSIEGGMRALARQMARCAGQRGTVFRTGRTVTMLEVQSGRPSGVLLDTGECLPADAVVFNGDVQALAEGALGLDLRAAVDPRPRQKRSLSALTWCLDAHCQGFALGRHSVFFSDDYAGEFEDILVRRRPPRKPTVYVCAQDRTESGPPGTDREALLVLINAPADGDLRTLEGAAIDEARDATFGMLRRCGLEVRFDPREAVVTQPADFERLFPGSGGGLYGSASHGWRSSFTRPASRSRIPGLYLAGGGVHPGPGVPMVALSGRLAAEAICQDFRLPQSLPAS